MDFTGSPGSPDSDTGSTIFIWVVTQAKINPVDFQWLDRKKEGWSGGESFKAFKVLRLVMSALQHSQQMLLIQKVVWGRCSAGKREREKHRLMPEREREKEQRRTAAIDQEVHCRLDGHFTSRFDVHLTTGCNWRWRKTCEWMFSFHAGPEQAGRYEAGLGLKAILRQTDQHKLQYPTCGHSSDYTHLTQLHNLRISKSPPHCKVYAPASLQPSLVCCNRDLFFFLSCLIIWFLSTLFANRLTITCSLFLILPWDLDL